MIELTINGKTVQAEQRATILQTALKNDIYIPHLCYDRRLAPYGGCRLCIVEVEGQRKLLASCSTPVEAGMVVHTETPALTKARGTVLELLLVHHPLDCPVCDQAGECDLQEMVYRYGRNKGRFQRNRKDSPPDDRGALIEMNSNRCILCGKCVRICSEYQGVGALGLIGRGFPTTVRPQFNEALDCDFCGQCIDTCPTGAIISKPYKFKARPWQLEEKETVCPFCGCGCTLTLGIRDGEVVRAKGRAGNGAGKEDLCGRGRFGFDYIYSENRLKTPLIRKSGRLVPASWQEALAYIGNALKDITRAHGASAIGAIGSPRCTNEDNLMLSRFMRTVIGSGNIDSSARFGYLRAREAFRLGFGVEAPPVDFDSPLKKEVVLVLESDLTSTHPVFGLKLLEAKRNGGRLIVADPKETKLARRSSQWLRLRPGTSVALLNGVMKALIDGALVKGDVEKISGFPDLKAALEDYSPDKVSAMTGIPAEAISGLAEELAKAGSRLLTLSLSVAENSKGLSTVLSAINLLLLLGEGPESLQVPAEFCNTYGLYKNGIRPDAGGKGIPEMLYTPGAVKALYIMGEDPLVNFPDELKIRETLKRLQLLVVQDIALTATAGLADVVLPAAGWAEKDGTFTNASGIEQRVRKVVDAPGDAMPDRQIIKDLAKAMGADIGANTETAETPAPSGPPAFNPIAYAPLKDEDYPLLMVTRDLLQHSGSMSTRSKSLSLVVAEAFLEINKNDALNCGIPDQSHVRVKSEKGALYLKARVSDSAPEGAVFVSTHFPHARVNLLTDMPKGDPALFGVKVEKIR